MALFGDIDAAEIPEDPFHVDDGTYLSVLTEVKAVVRNSDGQHGLAFKWTIIEEDSEFEGNTLNDWKNYYPDLTEEDLTPEIKKDLSRLKQRLTQLGVPEEEMNNFIENFEDYTGTEAYVTVKNTTDTKDPSRKYRNITFVRLPGEE
jgi:hypothetical protein